MSPAPETTTRAPLSAPVPDAAPAVRPPVWLKWVERAISVFLVIFALLLPLSVKGAHHVYVATAILWLALVIIGRRRILPQPLVAPLLLYLVFSAVSTILSPAQLLSWDRMKIVCLLMVCVVVAQNVRSLTHLKWIIAALAVGSLLTAAFTARQMTSGVGVQIRNLNSATALAQQGVEGGDVISSVAGRSVRTPDDFRTTLDLLPERQRVDVTIVRFNPFVIFSVPADRASIAAAGLLAPDAIAPVKPERAFGPFRHYITFAELLLQIALFTWGMLLASRARHRLFAILLLFAVAATSATLLATKTRSVLGALLLSALLVLWLASGRRTRIISVAVFAVLALAATLWVHHTRGLAWVDLRDPGTQYRLLLWKDGLHLVRQHPWFGVGMEAPRLYWRDWHMQAYAVFHTQSHFHSNWVQLAAERGLLTLAAWVWFVVGYVSFLVRLIRRSRPDSWLVYGIALGALGAMAGFLIESVVQYNLGEEQVVVALWFFAGLTFAAERLRANELGH